MDLRLTRYTMMQHLALWSFMLLFVFDYHWNEISWYEALAYSLLEVLTYMSLFYLNLLVLQSFYRKNKNILVYIVFCLLMVVTYVGLVRFSGLEYYLYEFESNRNVFSMVLNATLFIALSYFFFIQKEYFSARERNLTLKAENQAMQFEYLKARINPHFIFNTLNNMYALLLKKDENVPEMVNQLSNVLRYAVDDGSREYLPLTKEVDHLKDYIELLQMQEPASENIDFYVEGEIAGLEIIPFVLISFLENAIKHGDLKYDEEGWINIQILVEEQFEFIIENSHSGESNSSNGTGLENIQKQLELAYGQNSHLTIDNSSEKYSVKLTIDLPKMKSHAV